METIRGSSENTVVAMPGSLHLTQTLRSINHFLYSRDILGTFQVCKLRKYQMCKMGGDNVVMTVYCHLICRRDLSAVAIVIDGSTKSTEQDAHKGRTKSER